MPATLGSSPPIATSTARPGAPPCRSRKKRCQLPSAWMHGSCRLGHSNRLTTARTAMWTNKVIWSEGLFLQPQHLQQQDRYFEALVEACTGQVAAHHWGFVTLVIDEPQLALGKLA